MKLNKEELERLQQLNNSFNKLKIALGDLEIKRHSMLTELDGIKAMFSSEEKKFIDKYGSDSVINLQTGTVTKKETNVFRS